MAQRGGVLFSLRKWEIHRELIERKRRDRWFDLYRCNIRAFWKRAEFRFSLLYCLRNEKSDCNTWLISDSKLGIDKFATVECSVGYFCPTKKYPNEKSVETFFGQF